MIRMLRNSVRSSVTATSCFASRLAGNLSHSETRARTRVGLCGFDCLIMQAGISLMSQMRFGIYRMISLTKRSTANEAFKTHH